VQGSDIFTGTTADERPTSNEPHPFGRGFPAVSNGFPWFLSSIFHSPENSDAQILPWMLGSLFQLVPFILPSVLPISNEPLALEPVNEERSDKGKGKAPAVDSDDTDQSHQRPPPVEDEAFADILREAITASRRAGSHFRSLDEPGPSGSSTSTSTSDIVPSSSSPSLQPHTHSPGSESEQAEIDHAILMSSIEHIENSFHTLQANFTFPTRLDFYLPCDTDARASGPSAGELGAGRIAAYLSTTPANSTVLNFVQDLCGLLHRLHHVDCKNDLEAESMKEKAAGVINRALEDVESEVEEAIGKWMSMQVMS